MLIIRDAQMRSFQTDAQLRFEQDLVAHFLRTYPRECRQAGGERQIELLVKDGIERAGKFGFTGGGEISLFIALGFILGRDFYQDPQIPWAAELLSSTKIRNPSLRINAVYDRMLDYLEATAGERAQPVVKALIRLRDWDIDTAPELDGRWETSMLDLFRRIYPQKFDHQGKEANQFLLHDSLARCDLFYELRSRQGKALFSILMFMLGSGFDNDHLHPWAARILKTTKFTGGEQERVAALYKASREHLQQSLTSDELRQDAPPMPDEDDKPEV